MINNKIEVTPSIRKQMVETQAKIDAIVSILPALIAVIIPL
jgi:hypothetical protein